MLLFKKIALNTILHTMGKFGASLLGVVVVGLMARYLGVEGYGAYTTVLAYLFFFAVLSDLGLYVVTVNELSHSVYGQERFFNNIFTLRLVSALVFMGVADIIVWFLPYSYLIKIGVLVASLSVWLSLLDQVVVAFFQNKIKMWLVSLAEMAGKLVLLGLVFGLIKQQAGLWSLLLAVVVGFAVNLLINLIYLRKFIRLRLEIDWQVWREILAKAWPVAITMFFALIYFKADTLLLSLLPLNPAYHLTNNQAVGIYGAAYKILEVLIAWPAIFVGLVSPLLAKSWAERNIEKFRYIFQKAFDALMLVVWPMVIGGTVLAEPLIELIVGREFVVSAGVLQVLIWAVGMIFLTHLTTYSIIALGKQKQMIKFYVLAAGIALIGYVVFIPRYVYWAAAVITVLVEGFMLAATFYLLFKTSRIKVNLNNSFKAGLASVMMGLVLFWLPDWNLFGLIAIGGVVYLFVLYILGGLDKNIIRVLKLNGRKKF